MKANLSIESQVLTALKKAKVATQESVRRIVGGEIDTRNLASKEDVSEAILGSERRLKLQMSRQKREIVSLMVKLAETTPTRREFRALERRMDVISPAN